MLGEVLVSSGNSGEDGAAAAAALLPGCSGVRGGDEGAGSGTLAAGLLGLLDPPDEVGVPVWLLGSFAHSANGEERP